MKSFQIVFGLLLSAGAITAQQYNISTVAGIGTAQGYLGDGGPATSAVLDFPFKVALDSKGNYYIVDFYTFVVRQVSGGTINTFAGTGVPGFQGDSGPAIQAQLSYIHGVAADPGGNVYMSDTTNGRVRFVNPSGDIYTFAGTGTPGYSGDGGKAINAQINSPAGIVSDAAGNIYFSDYGNATVRKVDTKGIITTFAGTGVWGYSGDGGPASKAALAHPVALAVDSASNLYIADPGNLNIREVTTDGNIHTIVSNVDAESLAVDSAGSLYYPNWYNSTVQKILSNGTQFTIAGNGTPGFSGDGGPATLAQLNQPYGVAVDPSGNVYVADFNNMAIRLLTPVASSISVVNAASGVGLAVSPGELVAIYGTGLGPAIPAVQQPVNGVYGTQLAGTTVNFNGINAPILYASSSQVTAIVPYAMANTSMATATVNYQLTAGVSAAVPVVPAAPGIFTANASGIGQIAAVNQDGTVNSVTNPAHQGTVISFYLTGEGSTNPPGTDGAITPLPPAPPITPIQQVQVFLSNQIVPTTYVAEAPGSVAGLMQINAMIPPNLIQAPVTAPVPVPVQVIVGSSFTQPGVMIAVVP
jgi:uncharacterized protein (TIGR03437 family)